MIQLVRIAVCDDEPAFAERVKILIEAECRGLGVSAEVSLYTDSGMLAYDIGEKRYFDMLFLDIEMPGLSGMELADLIKDSLPQALVSFITSHTKYTVKSFELSIFRYIPKAEVENCLPMAVSDGIRLLSWKVKECYVVETPRQIIKVAVSDILYIYKKQKYSVMVLEDGEIPVRKALGQLKEELDREEFLMIERGYVINLYHVWKMEGTSVVLDNKTVLPVSQNHAKEVRETITGFFRRHL